VGPVVHLWAGGLLVARPSIGWARGCLAGWAVSSAELVEQAAERDAECVGYPVPGVE